MSLGEALPLYSAVPFAGMLLSIALMPLFLPRFWHHHFGKVAAFWAFVAVIPVVIAYPGSAIYEFTHVVVADYVPFIILLWALFTVSGGILLRGTLVGTPVVNTVMLVIGTALASWMGTTGAAMLLIRPFLRANAHRRNRAFMVVFFIFLVANIGGALTPLGDPPLFLGFLHGVPFTWTFNILPQMLTVAATVLVIYFFFDSYMYKKEGVTPPANGAKEPLKLEGSHNFIYLAGIVGAVLMSGVADWGAITLFGVHRSLSDLARDGILVVMGVLSVVTTSRKVREDNQFTWSPILEVAYLFAGIFISMVPCLLILKAGTKGELAFLMEAVKEPAHYFWASGLLSSFLDNAPTYLTFFSTALGSYYPGMPEGEAVPKLIAENAIYLKAISCGSVFMGANTYIGNAPNFMVRSIAEEAGVAMPSFFGYMVKYSIPVLCTTFVIITYIFF
ncbi:MAG: sodium:proton antiporter [Pseudomonadota bacterium]